MGPFASFLVHTSLVPTIGCHGIRVVQWQLLRRLLTDGERSEGELSKLLSRDVSSVGRSLKSLQAKGLVELRAGEGSRIGRGNPKGWWSLTEAGHEALASLPVPAERERDSADADAARGADESPDRHRERRIEPHQAFAKVAATDAELPNLLDALSTGEQAAEATAVVRLDGAVHNYLFLFDSRLGVRPAEMFAVALAGTGLTVETGVVADVRGFTTFIQDLRAATSLAEAVGRASRDREASRDAPGASCKSAG